MPIRDFSNPNQGNRGPKIVGAQPTHIIGETEILDRTKGAKGVGVEVRVHEETVIEGDAVRSKKREKSEPEVRVRIGDTKNFDAVKRGED